MDFVISDIALVYLSLGVLVLLMALCAWWAYTSFKKARWVQFTIAVVLLLVMGLGWTL